MKIVKQIGKDVLVADDEYEYYARLELRGQRGYECSGVWRLELTSWEPRFRLLKATSIHRKAFAALARQFAAQELRKLAVVMNAEK